MRYRGKYFPALWLDMRGHPTCRRSRACVAGHVSLVRACSGQRFPLVIRCDAYIRCGLHPWARRKRSICVVTSWTKYSSMDVFSVQFLVTCPPSCWGAGGGGGKGRQNENIVMEPVKQPDGDALVTFTMMLRTIKNKNKNKKAHSKDKKAQSE